jgi:hypothetical protein
MIKRWYSGLTILTKRIEPRRTALLRDAEVLQLLRAAHISGMYGESFETFIKSMMP